MGLSKHDSIDNNDSFYLQPIKIAQTTSDVFLAPQNPRNLDPVMGNLTWISEIHVRFVGFPPRFGKSAAVYGDSTSGSVRYLGAQRELRNDQYHFIK